MSDPLADFWVHQVTVTPKLSDGPYGSVNGTPFAVPCFVDEKRRLVRSVDGSQVVSEATVYAATGIVIPLGSLVLLPSGRTAEVLAVSDHTSGGLDLPDHVEVALT